MKTKRSEERDLKLLIEIIQHTGDINLTLSTFAAFNLIGLLQFAARGLPPGHNQLATLRDLAELIESRLLPVVGETHRRPFQELIAAGWDTTQDVIEDNDGLPIIEVHNRWTIYGLNPDGSESDQKLACFGARPQDWGHPRWTYHQFRFDWITQGKHYINHAHCWTDLVRKEYEYAQMFAPLICQIMQPGDPAALCGRDYLHEEDFWQEAWGDMPPIFDDPEDNFAEWSIPYDD